MNRERYNNILEKLNKKIYNDRDKRSVSPTSNFLVKGEIPLVRKFNINRDWLYKKYWIENESVMDISKEIKCNRRTVYRHLKKFNINVKGRRLALIGKKFSSLHKEKISISETGVKKFSDEQRRILSESMKAGRALDMIQKIPYCDTKIERLIENQLLFKNILYVKQYRYKLGIADFWLPEINAIIECDGEYWHSKLSAKERDEKQTEWLEDNDYVVYRFPGKEIIKNPVKCIEEIYDG